MNILVTGATGFVGGRVVKELSEHGLFDPFDTSSKKKEVNQIIACGRNVAKGRDLSALPKVVFEKIDLADEQAVMSLSQKYSSIDIVVHSAALCSHWGWHSDFYRANVSVTEHMIKLCRKMGSVLVHVSSSSVYVSGTKSIVMVKEDYQPTSFVSGYAETKYLSDVLVEQYERSVILRPRAIIGPGDELLLPKTIDGLKTGRLPIVGDNVVTDLTYVDNLVDAILSVAYKLSIGKKLKHKIYNITNGEPILFTDVVEMIAKELNYPTPTRRLSFFVAFYIGYLIELIWYPLSFFTEKLPPVSRHVVTSVGLTSTLDISRAQEDFNYNPRVSLQEGFRRTFNYIKSNKLN